MSFICLLGSCCYGLITSVPILPRKKEEERKWSLLASHNIEKLLQKNQGKSFSLTLQRLWSANQLDLTYYFIICLLAFKHF